MTYTLKILREKRFSIKILAGKIRKYAPGCLYDFLLEVRFSLFRKCCKQTASPTIGYSDGAWIVRKTTSDLINIQTWLANTNGPLSIFQAGVGNSSLYGAVKNKVDRFVGITIVQDEVSFARKLYPEDFGNNYNVYLANKYSESLINFGKGFDYIIDNDISSYACCHFHFDTMLKTYRAMLKQSGIILVGLQGLGYFDSGFGLTEQRMKVIAMRHAMILEKNNFSFVLRLV